MTEELLSYISQAKKKGVKEEEIKNKLVALGWEEKIVTNALDASENDLTPPAPPLNGKAIWDAFEHILLFISLILVSVSFMNLFHAFVDGIFPAVQTDRFVRSDSWNHTRLTIFGAILIVSFPLFIGLFIDVKRRTLRLPFLAELKARRVLTYLTLIIAFIVMMYNAIYLVYNFLDGNVTTNFLINFAITVGIFGTVFFYYLSQVKSDRVK